MKIWEFLPYGEMVGIWKKTSADHLDVQLTISGLVCAARVMGATETAVAESGYSTIASPMAGRSPAPFSFETIAE